jgi:4-hydroxy-tetrahydrodipicolinate synthase
VPVKTALNLMGLGAGDLRLPLVEMEPKNLEALKKSLKGVGLLN